MNWNVFLWVWIWGIAFVVLQAIAADRDGYLTQKDMRERHNITNGWSFMEHGGMWADVFVISPVVAYSVANYQLMFFSKWGIVILIIAIAVSLLMGRMYQEGGKVTPEAHTHDGYTTIAGWIHGLYAVAAIWVVSLMFFNLATPSVSRVDIVLISVLLTPFFDLGARKFSKRWAYTDQAIFQVSGGIVLVWIAAAVRLWLF